MTTAPKDAVKLLAQRILDTGYDDLPARERHGTQQLARRLALETCAETITL